jgi:hypothetical protein
MTKLIGRQVAVGIGREATRGTADAIDYWLPWMEATIETRIERAINESSIARLEDSDGADIVSAWGEGTIKGKMKDQSFGLLLLSLFGTDTPALVETGVYDHVYSVEQTTQHDSLTIAVKDANLDEAYPNAVIDSIKLDVELGNYVMMEAAFMSKQDESDSNTVSISAERDFVPQMFEFKKAATQAGLDGASATSIRNASIEMRSNVMREDVLGVANADPNDILNQSFTIEGTITLVHNDTTFEDLQNNDTYQALRLKLTHTDTIGAASNPTLTIDLHRAKIFDYERNLSQNDLIEETFSFKAHYSITDSKMVTCTLRNTVVDYTT